MKIDRKKVIQWSILSTLFSVGFLAFLVLAGEDDPQNPLPLGRWLTVKGCAAAVVYFCIKLGKYLDRKGLIPEIDENEIP